MSSTIELIENYFDSKPFNQIKLDDLDELSELMEVFYSSIDLGNNKGGFFNGTYNATNMSKGSQEILGTLSLYSPKIILIDNLYSWFSQSKYSLLSQIPESDSKIHIAYEEKRSFKLLLQDNKLSKDEKIQIASRFIESQYNQMKALQPFIDNGEVVLIPYYDILQKKWSDIKTVELAYKNSDLYKIVNDKFDDMCFENSDECAYFQAAFKDGDPAFKIKPGSKATVPQFRESRAFYVTKNLLLSKTLNSNYCPSSEGNTALHFSLINFLCGEINKEFKTELSITKILFFSDLFFFHNGSIKDAFEIRKNSDGFHEWRTKLFEVVNTFDIDFNSKREVQNMTKEVFSPVSHRIQLEIQRSKSLSNFFSKNDLFAFVGGFLGGLTNSTNTIEQCLATGAVTSIATSALNFIKCFGKPELQGIDSFVYNILRYKDKKRKKR